MTELTQETLFSSNTQPENERLALLKQHFPNCFDKHGAFLPDKLAEILHSDGIHTQKEGYSLNWLGKSYARVLKDTPPETLLAEDTEHNRQPENANSENLLIKGDNLEVLKHLKHAYKNQIKMIYIDPPYNTGSDGFVYQDDRKFTPQQLAELGGMSLEEAERVLEFTAKKSNSHSAWLTFMYPRLYVARELLREDGVIFISIDDNEQAQLKILCDEVFGEENFEGHIHWRRRHNQPNDKTKMIGLVAEHILCYAKNSQYYKTSGVGKLPLTGRFSNPDNDPRGDWATKPWKTGSDQTGTTYSITTPTGKVYIEEWMGEYETFDKLLKDNRIIFTNNGDGLPRKKYFKFEREEEGQCATNWWEHTLFGHNQLGSQELTDLFGQKNIFSNPKNTTLIKSLIAISNAKNNDFVLDFFAGSGTTAHTVKQLNRENQDLNLRYICIQLPENLDEALKTASAENKKIIQNAINLLEKHKKPHNLFEITKARIELAAVKIHAENPDYSGDLGFKIFETVPNFQAALTDDFNPQQADLPDTKDTALSDEQLHTLLTTWRVYDGCRLPEKVQAIDLAGYTAYYCRQHLYLLASGFHSECVKALIEKLDNDKDFVPGRIVLFSQNMDSAIQKELAQAVKTYANKKGLNNLSVLARVF